MTTAELDKFWGNIQKNTGADCPYTFKRHVPTPAEYAARDAAMERL